VVYACVLYRCVNEDTRADRLSAVTCGLGPAKPQAVVPTRTGKLTTCFALSIFSNQQFASKKACIAGIILPGNAKFFEFVVIIHS
jgi:hypothetical protein